MLVQVQPLAQNGELAQLGEHLPYKQEVGGSSPSFLTIIRKGKNMQNVILLPLMIFCHIVDDYYLQAGLLANLKQKSNWEKMDGYSSQYKYDYIVALLTHGFSWSFMILLPLLIYNWDNILNSNYFLLLIIQTVIHSFIDDLKANKRKINLIQDQSIHLLQIIFSWVFF